MTTNSYLTTAQVKEILGCTSKTQLYRWHKAGKLIGQRRGGRVVHWEWDPEPIEAFRREREEEARVRAERDALILARWSASDAPPYRQIADEMGLPHNTVWNVIRKAGVLRRVSP